MLVLPPSAATDAVGGGDHATINAFEIGEPFLSRSRHEYAQG